MRTSLHYRESHSLLAWKKGPQVVQRLYSIARAARHVVFDMNNVFKTPAADEMVSGDPGSRNDHSCRLAPVGGNGIGGLSVLRGKGSCVWHYGPRCSQECPQPAKTPTVMFKFRRSLTFCAAK